MSDLVTGSNGFLGRTFSSMDLPNTIYASHSSCSASNKNIFLDLTCVDSITETLKQYKIKRIFNLVGTFTNNFQKDFQVNVTITRNILEAVLSVDKNIKILLVGSSAEYGLVGPAESPISEISELKPASIYALTKVFQTNMMKYYISKFGLNIVMARPFNLLGQNCSDKLFIGRLYSQIKQFKNSEIKVIKLGNLSASRDYIKVEEAAQHFLKIMNCGVSGQIYNVASGLPIKIETLLTNILREEKILMKYVLIDESRSNVSDVDIIYADITKLKELYND